MVNLVLDIGLTGLIFGTISFVLVVILYVFYFTRFKHESESSCNLNKQITVVRLASTEDDEDIDVNNPPLSIDKTLLSVDDVLLLKNQTDPSLNGVYSVEKGRGTTPYKLTRVEVPEGCLVRVRYGIENHSKLFTVLYDKENSGRVSVPVNHSIEVEEYGINVK